MALAFDPYASFYERKARESRGGPKVNSEEIYDMYQGAAAGKYATETARRSQAASERYQEGNLGLQREQLGLEREKMDQQQKQQQLGMLVNAPLYAASIERMTNTGNQGGWVTKGGKALYGGGKDLYNQYFGSTPVANNGTGAAAMEAGLESAYGSGFSGISGMGEYGEAAYSGAATEAAEVGAYAGEASEVGAAGASPGLGGYAAIAQEGYNMYNNLTSDKGEGYGAAYGANFMLTSAYDNVVEPVLKMVGLSEPVNETGRWLDDNVFQPVKNVVSGDTVICTELAKQGHVSWELISLEHHYHFDPEVYAGYRTWADSYVRLMQRSRLASLAILPLASAFLREVAHRVEPSRPGNLLGKAIIALGQPICRLAYWLAKKEVCYG